MKKSLAFKSLSRNDLAAITGGGSTMKAMRVCGPSCASPLGALKCNQLGCECIGRACGF